MFTLRGQRLMHFVLFIWLVTQCGYTSGQVKGQDKCPETPSGVTLTAEANLAGEGVLPCSLDEYPGDDVVVRFTWEVDGVTSNTWVREVKGEKAATLPAKQMDVDLFEKKIKCFAELKFQGGKFCDKIESGTITPTITCPALTPITIAEGDTHTVDMKLNAPPSMYCNSKRKPNCGVDVFLELVPHVLDLKCTEQDIIPQAVLQTEDCVVQFTRKTWKTGLTIPIKAVLDGMKDGDRKIQLQVTVGINGQTPKYVECGSVEVTVTDDDKPALCISHGDPHLVTFDQLTFDNQIFGEFVVYKHKTLPYEVRSDQVACTPPWGATCNCKVAVKVGDDVFTFSGCNGPITTVQLYKNGELTPGTIVKRFGDGKIYEVYIPTGTKITIDNNGVCLNIFVQGSMSEFSNTEGMCGNFNGNIADDLEGGRVQEFNMKWRRTDSIFKGVAPSPTSATPTYCYCVRFRKPDCRTSLDNFRCNVFDLSDITNLLVKHAKTPAPTKTTRRRRADDTPPEVGLKSSNYTNAEATEICKDVIENSKTVEICSDYLPNATVSQSITDCTFDIETLGESDWAEAHVSTLAELCIAEARKDPSLWTGNGTTPGEPELPQDIAGGLCVKDCGQNGECVNALCRCKNGFGGVTCQVSPDSRPVVTPGVELCDLMTSTCGSFVVDGFHFTSSKNLTCIYNYVTPDLKPVPGVSRGTSTADRINLQQVGCTMAPDQSRTALVSVGAGGVTSEQSLLYVVYNSSCQTCAVADQGEKNVTCQWKPNHCVINDKCYSNLQVDPANSCQVCDLAASTAKWTRLNAPQCKPTVKPIPQWCPWYNTYWCYYYRYY